MGCGKSQFAVVFGDRFEVNRLPTGSEQKMSDSLALTFQSIGASSIAQKLLSLLSVTGCVSVFAGVGIFVVFDIHVYTIRVLGNVEHASVLRLQQIRVD